jgi:hypothetical protein
MGGCMGVVYTHTWSYYDILAHVRTWEEGEEAGGAGRDGGEGAQRKRVLLGDACLCVCMCVCVWAGQELVWSNDTGPTHTEPPNKIIPAPIYLLAAYPTARGSPAGGPALLL